MPKTKLLQLGCARGRQCFGNLLLECHQPRSAQLWMDAGARRVFFGQSVALLCGEIVTNGDQRKTTGLQSASSRWNCLMPVGGGTVPDWQCWKPRALFFCFVQKRVEFPPAAQGLACQHSRAGGEGQVLTRAESSCARACRKHSQEFLPAMWARCFLHVMHLHMVCAYLPTHRTENMRAWECVLTPRSARSAMSRRTEQALTPHSP